MLLVEKGRAKLCDHAVSLPAEKTCCAWLLVDARLEYVCVLSINVSCSPKVNDSRLLARVYEAVASYCVSPMGYVLICLHDTGSCD